MRCESRLKCGLLEELTRSLPSYKQKGEKNLFSKHGFVIFYSLFLLITKSFHGKNFQERMRVFELCWAEAVLGVNSGLLTLFSKL